MNILFVLPRQHPNQAGWYKALKAQKHGINYIVAYSLPVNERQDLPEPFVITGTSIPLWYSLMIWFYRVITKQAIQKHYLLWPDKKIIANEIQKLNPDLIIIREAFTPLALVCQQVANRLKISTIHYTQAPLQKRDNLLSLFFRKIRVLPKYRMSPTLKKNGVTSSLDKNFYIPLFTPAAVMTPPKINEEVIRFLFVGKFNSRRKKHLLLIEALAILSINKRVHLTMVGSTVFFDQTYHNEIVQKIKESGLDNNVRLIYDIDPLSMGEIYQTHDVFVLPSVDEPFSISPLEAMAYGLPAIVTDSNGCKFHIKNTENGFVIKSNDLEDLVRVLTKVSDRELLTFLQRGALVYTKNQNNEKLFLDYFNKMVSEVTK